MGVALTHHYVIYSQHLKRAVASRHEQNLAFNKLCCIHIFLPLNSLQEEVQDVRWKVP